jgi:hypothetical protein
MPAGEATIGRVRIFPATWVPADALERLPKAQTLAPTMLFEDEQTGEEAESVAVGDVPIRVVSRWVFSIDLGSIDEDEMQEVAEHHLADALAALHLEAEGPYVAVILRFETDGEGRSSWASVTGHAPEVGELKTAHVDTANNMLPHLGSSRTAEISRRYIARGVELGHVAPSLGELGPFVLLNFFMGIEAIADAVTSDVRQAMRLDLQAELATASEAVREELIQGSEKSALEVIREGAKTFSRIEFHYSDLKVVRAGEELALSPEQIEDARRFSRFRNQYLGHPRSEVPADEAGYWWGADRAFRLSNAYLRHFLQRGAPVDRA